MHWFIKLFKGNNDTSPVVEEPTLEDKAIDHIIATKPSSVTFVKGEPTEKSRASITLLYSKAVGVSFSIDSNVYGDLDIDDVDRSIVLPMLESLDKDLKTAREEIEEKLNNIRSK